VICPDYSEASKFADLWLAPQAGHRRGAGDGDGHVILREFHVDRQVPYFEDYCRRYTDMPMLVKLVEQDGACARALLRASDFDGGWARPTIPNGRPSPRRAQRGEVVVPNGSVGFRWGEGREGQVEPGGEGRRRGARPSCG
jgi:nitrate reductase alpha subunit